MNLCAEEIAAQPDGRRTEPDTFESAIERIERAVLASCEGHAEWPSRVSAGIRAALDFLIANPGAARVLAIDSRSAGPELDTDYVEMIGRFATLLGDGAPRSARQPASSDRSVVTVITAIVTCHIRAGTVESLRAGDPDLVFLALLPYVGFAEACRWSSTLSR